MHIIRYVLTVLFLYCCLLSYSQTDSAVKKNTVTKSENLSNTAKLNLIYQTRTYMVYSRYGSYPSSITTPMISVNDSTPVSLYKLGYSSLKKYYVRAPLADLQLDLANKEQGRSIRYFWGGFAVGGTILFSGLFAAVKSDNTTVFAIAGGLAVGSLITGPLLSRSHKKKADKALKRSIDIYNEKYYMQLPADTLKK